MVSLPATWETRGERRLKEGPGFLEEQLHGARGEAGDWSHGGGWDSTDAEVVNSTTGADFPGRFSGTGYRRGETAVEGQGGWRDISWKINRGARDLAGRGDRGWR